MKANEEKAAVVRVEQRQENLPAPIQGMAEIEKLGKFFETSGMFNTDQQGQGVVLAMICVMKRKSPDEIMEDYHLQRGRLTMKAEAMLARLLELGGAYKILERTTDKCSMWAKFRDAEYTGSLSFDEVQKEPFAWVTNKHTGKQELSSNYATPRKRMQLLWARVCSDTVRAVCPLATRSRYTPEEVAEFGDDAARNITPQVGIGPAIMTAPSTSPTAPTEAAPEVVTPEVIPVDFSVMPMKTAKYPVGTKFSDMDKDTLAKVLKLAESKQYPDLTTGHAAAIKTVLEGGAK